MRNARRSISLETSGLDQLETFLARGRTTRGEEALLEALDGHPSVFGVIADHIPQMIWLARDVGCLDYCNRRWMEYTGLSLEQSLAPDGWLSAIHPDDREVCLTRWRESAVRKTDFQGEYRLRRADGMYRWHIGRAARLHDDVAGISWWIGSCTDNHEQRKSQDLDRVAVRTLQRALLPDSLPSLDGISFDGYYSPASEDFLVGGDWYNAFVLPDGRVAIVIGDVEGHGMAAAVAMAEIRLSFIITAMHEPYSATEVVARANRTLNSRSHSNVTVIFGIFDPRTRMLTYAVAGHPRPVLVNPSGEAQYLEDGGVPLGVLDSLEVPLHEQHIEPGSMLVFYTDGLTDFDRKIDINEERLLAAAQTVQKSHVAWPAFALREVMVGDHLLPDDLAILTMLVS